MLLPLVARCLETIDVCIWRMFVFMSVVVVSFVSKVRPRTFGCVAMGSALLFTVRSRLLVYSAGSGVNRVQVVLSGFSKRLFCPGKYFVYVWLYVFLG